MTLCYGATLTIESEIIVVNNDGNKHSYVIQHDMGIKWSIYLASLYRFLFDELGKRDEMTQ